MITTTGSSHIRPDFRANRLLQVVAALHAVWWAALVAAPDRVAGVSTSERG